MQSKSFFDPRRTAYYTGALQMVYVEMYGIDMEHELSDSRTVAKMLTDAVGITMHVAPAYMKRLEEKVNNEVERRHHLFNEFDSQSTTDKAVNAYMCGYDPMNMLKVDSRILCNHFVFLCEGETRTIIKGPVMITVEEGEKMHVSQYRILKE